MSTFLAAVSGGLGVSDQFAWDFSFPFVADQTITWGDDVCVERFYRVIGSCTTPKDLGCDPEAPPGCDTQVMMNISACDLEDLCRKIRARRFFGRIDRIDVFPNLLHGPEDVDPQCLIAVPIFSDGCEECCDFLLDEEVNFTAGVSSDYFPEYLAPLAGDTPQYGQAAASLAFSANLSGIMHPDGQLSPTSSAYHHDLGGVLSTYGAFGVISSAYHHSLGGGAVLYADPWTNYSHLLADAGGVLLPTGAFGRLVGFLPAVSGITSLSSGLSPHVGYHLGVGGTVNTDGVFGVSSSNYSLSVGGVLSPQSSFGIQSSAYYSAIEGTLTPYSSFGIGLAHQMSGAQYPDGTLSGVIGVVMPAGGSFYISSDFVTHSSGFTAGLGGDLVAGSSFFFISSDLGTIDVDAGADVTEDEAAVLFGIDPAEAATPALTQISLPGCCSLLLPSVLRLQHNLGQVEMLARFLRLNNATLPGSTTAPSDFTKLIYHRTSGSWRNNLHYVGSDPYSASSTQTWDVITELACQPDAQNLSSNVWVASLLLRVKDPSLSVDMMARLVLTFDVATVCPRTASFQGLNVVFDVRTLRSTPDAIYPAVFSDDEGLVKFSPAFIKDTKLRLNFLSPSSGTGLGRGGVDFTEQLRDSEALGN